MIWRPDPDDSNRLPESTDDVLVAVEAHLGVKLPDDYLEANPAAITLILIERQQHPRLPPSDEAKWQRDDEKEDECSNLSIGSPSKKP